MAGRAVSFKLDTGETLTVAREDLQRACSLLWGLAPKPGAASTAAIVHFVSRQAGLSVSPYELTATQSGMLREVLALLRA